MRRLRYFGIQLVYEPYWLFNRILHGGDSRMALRLKDDIRGLAAAEAKVSQLASPWEENTRILNELILSRSLARFCRWPVVKRTMFVGSAEYVKHEIDYLRMRLDWNQRWRAALRETAVGCPEASIYYPRSSGNLIHHGYHVSQLEAFIPRKVSELEFVLEFGGGYGSMCRLFHRLGFRGSYVIYDLPTMVALQRYFLESLGLKTTRDYQGLGEAARIALLTGYDDLTHTISRMDSRTQSLFVATWSLSETPLDIRPRFAKLAAQFRYFLIAFQQVYDGTNNGRYFDLWASSLSPGVEWRKQEITHLPGNSYLLGRRSLNG